MAEEEEEEARVVDGEWRSFEGGEGECVRAAEHKGKKMGEFLMRV